MKISKFLWLLVVSCQLLVSTALAVPQYLNYQGVLRDSSRNLITGTRSMVFNIYDEATAGTLKFTMTSAEVSVNGGLYNVMLGPLGYAELGSGRRWLEVAVGGETLTPRIELASVAYAVTAAVAQSVSAEATGNAFAVYVNGKIGAVVGTCVGSGEIASGGTSVTITNSNVTANSRIFITPAPTTYTYALNKSLRVKTITANTSFVVETLDGAMAHATNPMPFSYFIIN